MLTKKEKRDAVLYVRITTTNKDFITKESERLNYATLSEFIDTLIGSMRAGKPKKKKA